GGDGIGHLINVNQWDGGGFTGNMPVDQFAGFVHGQEGVLNAQEIRAIGGEAGFNALRRMIRAGGNAIGGMGGRPSLSMPSAPAQQLPAIIINSTINPAPGTSMGEMNRALDQRDAQL